MQEARDRLLGGDLPNPLEEIRLPRMAGDARGDVRPFLNESEVNLAAQRRS